MSGFFSTLQYGYTLLKINNMLANTTLEQLEDEQFYVDLKKHIYYCGCIGIKFIQWYISRLRTYSDEKSRLIVEHFEDIFDQCPYHDMKHNKQIFKDNFDHELEDIFDMDYFEPIASGSIGQVYVTKFKGTENRVAVKIKHPNVDNNIKDNISMVGYLKILQKYQYFRNKLNLYFDFEDFVENLTLQADFKNEAYNTIKFRQLYKDNDSIVFPKVYYFTKDIIISEYIEGEEFNSMSQVSKLKVCINSVIIYV